MRFSGGTNIQSPAPRGPVPLSPMQATEQPVGFQTCLPAMTTGLARGMDGALRPEFKPQDRSASAQSGG